MKKLLLCLFCGFIGVQLSAQISNAQIIKIKEDADDGKALWTKLFEDSYTRKSMSELPALRKANQDFLNENISKLSRLYGEGDGRELVVAVKNYLVVEKQFVNDVMIPAESLQPGDEQTYNDLNRKIADFTQKERSFEIDITNAIRTSPEPVRAEPQDMASDEPEQEINDDEIRQREDAKPRRKEKLPHETYNKRKAKKNKGNYYDEEAED